MFLLGVQFNGRCWLVFNALDWLRFLALCFLGFNVVPWRFPWCLRCLVLCRRCLVLYHVEEAGLGLAYAPRNISKRKCEQEGSAR
jgi:hypothetical protein